VFETRPELSTSELARITQVTRQTMHTSIPSLEAAALVERRAKLFGASVSAADRPWSGRRGPAFTQSSSGLAGHAQLIAARLTVRNR
jgi:hypothetical protein